MIKWNKPLDIYIEGIKFDNIKKVAEIQHSFGTIYALQILYEDGQANGTPMFFFDNGSYLGQFDKFYYNISFIHMVEPENVLVKNKEIKVVVKRRRYNDNSQRI